MKRAIQYFNKEYLERCSRMTPDQILEFLEDYRMLLFQAPEKCQQINIKIEPSLLHVFKQKAELDGVPYQTQIKRLMREWINP